MGMREIMLLMQSMHSPRDSFRDSPELRDSIARQIRLAAALMLRAHQRRQAIARGEPWPADHIVDPALVGASRRVGGYSKPGLKEAVGAVAELVLDGLSVNRASKVVASRIVYQWETTWRRHAEQSDDFETLSGATLANQLRAAYNRTRL
jgi:hypothetical protein